MLTAAGSSGSSLACGGVTARRGPLREARDGGWRAWGAETYRDASLGRKQKHEHPEGISEPDQAALPFPRLRLFGWLPPRTAGEVRPGAVVLLAILLLGAAASAWLVFRYPHQNLGPSSPSLFPPDPRRREGHQLPLLPSFVERSARAGIPEVGKCLYCHNYIIPKHPQILKEHDYFNTGTPVPWKRLFVAKDFVFFRHQPHILRNFDCTECHGDVKTMDRLPQHTFQMGFCIQCHRRNEASLECWKACHN